MKKEVLVLLSILLASSASAQLADSPWPMFHGGAQHGGLSAYDTSHVDGTVKWKFDTGGGIYSSPVIAEDGTIYVGNQNSDMFAVNPDGTLKWKFDAGERVESEAYPGNFHGILSVPAIDSKGVLYFTSLDNYLFAVNPDGTLKWKFPVKRNDAIWSSPAIDEDGTIYIGSYIYEIAPYVNVGYVFAINPDGTEKWKFETTHVHPSTAISKDGVLYVGGATPIKDGEVIGLINALDRDGNLIWDYAFETWQESSPSIGENGMIYIGSKEGKVYAIDSKGTVKWTYQVDPGNIDEIPEGESKEYVDEYHLNGVSALPAIGPNGTIYVGAWNSYLYALMPDGRLKWKFKTPAAYEGVSSSAAIGAEGTIYFGSNSGNFYALHPNGTEKWKFKGPLLGGIIGSPAIGADGTVYIGSNSDGHLYAFGGPGEGRVEAVEEEFKAAPMEEFEPAGEQGTCPDGVWDEREQANPKLCPPDNPNLSEEEKEKPATVDYDRVPAERTIPEELHVEPTVEKSFFDKILGWLKGLFGNPVLKQKNTDIFDAKFAPGQEIATADVCLTAEEYESGAPILSIPFNLEDYMPKHWGMIPFCADPWQSGNIHGALDFELKPDAKVFAATDGIVEQTQVGEAEGSGEIIMVQGDGFSLGYSGLGNVQVKAGDEIKKGDYIANVVQIPHGEYHVHLGISIDGREECPIKYMDQEFKDALNEMFSQAHYLRQDEEPCACNCEHLTSS